MSNSINPLYQAKTIQSISDIFLETNNLIFAASGSTFYDHVGTESNLRQCHQTMSEKISFFKAQGAPDTILFGWAEQVFRSMDLISRFPGGMHHSELPLKLKTCAESAEQFLNFYDTLYAPMVEKQSINLAIQSMESKPQSGGHKI